MRFNKLIWSTASAVVLASLAVGTPVYAQSDAVSDIVVTAQKREQRLQDIPVTVTVATKQLLDDAGVNDIKDLQVLVPGLTVTSTTTVGSTTARIRGIGTVGDNPGLESSVGVVIDGVYRPRDGVGFGDLGQVSRIEVLKGPQGTLFGKNNSAGVISVVTAAPSFTFGGEGELTAGNYEARAASLYLTGPLIGDFLAGSLYGSVHRREGFVSVSTPAAAPGAITRSPEGNDEDYQTYRGQLQMNFNDRLSGRIIADFTERHEDCCLATQLYVGQQAGNALLPLDNPNRQRSAGLIVNDIRAGSLDPTNTPFDRVAYANRPSNQNIRDKGLSGQFDYDFSDSLTLTSITAVRQWENKFSMDADYTAADLLYRPDDGSNGNKFKQLSQELRIAGDTDRLNWLAGVFLAKEDLDSDQVLLNGGDFYNFLIVRSLGGVPAAAGINSVNGVPLGSGTRDTHRQEDKSAALFLNGDYKITDDLTLTLGVRFTHDKKELDSVYTTTGATCGLAQANYSTNPPFPGIRPAITGFTTPDPVGVPVGTTQTIVANTIVSKLCSNQTNAAFDALSAGAPLHQERSDDNISGTAKLSYKVNDGLLTYVSYSRGFKAGGFNLDRVARVTGAPSATASQVFGANPNTSFSEETVDSYEIGAKFQFGRNLLLNAAAFDQEFDNFQYNTFAGTSFIVTSLPKVTTKGVDVDVFYNTPIAGLSLQGGVTYAETKIGTFTPVATGFPPTVGPSFNRLSGNTLSFSPKVSTSLAVTYETSISETLEIRGNLSGKYSSRYNTGSDLNPIKEQGGYTVLNARVALQRKDGRLGLELWAQNLTDKDYLQVGFNGPYQAGDAGTSSNAQNDAVSVYDAFLGAPATYGVTLRSKF